MKGIQRDLIQPGFVLPGALRDKAGRVLFPAGTTLDEARIAKLGRRILTGLFGGDDWPDDPVDSSAEAVASEDKSLNDASEEAAGSPTQTRGSNGEDPAYINVDLLRVGMQLSCDIFDRAGVLLLAAGSQVTSRFLLLLQHRDIKVVCTQSSEQRGDAVSIDNPCVNKLESRLATALRNEPEFKVNLSLSRGPQLPLRELWSLGRSGLDRHMATTAVLADVSSALTDGQSIASETMRSLISEFFDMLTLDCDLLSTIVSIQKSCGEYLFDHSVNVALMGMTMATHMGLRRDQVLCIGLGAVLQDVGMLRVPKEIRLACRTLTPDERTEIERHPIYTLEYLEQVRGLPIEASFIGYQAHERLDGSGYPRQRMGTTTHPFAKIVAVADTYCAMTQARPHRPATCPHVAVKQLLIDGSQGKFDRMILRAFLDCVSAFPIGSQVQLMSGILGQVVRANHGAHTHPVIATLDSSGAPTDNLINLASEVDLNIVGASFLEARAEPALA